MPDYITKMDRHGNVISRVPLPPAQQQARNRRRQMKRDMQEFLSQMRANPEGVDLVMVAKALRAVIHGIGASDE